MQVTSHMASNTLKDMNSLHVTEKISDCKASLTKPCVGKMNGKSEDRPLPNPASLDSSDPKVVEAEKPEPEKAIVEVEYIESENLDNVDDANAILEVIFFCLYFCIVATSFPISISTPKIVTKLLYSSVIGDMIVYAKTNLFALFFSVGFSWTRV